MKNRRTNKNLEINKKKLEVIGDIGSKAVDYLANKFDIKIAEKDESTYFQLIAELIEARIDKEGVKTFIGNEKKIKRVAYQLAHATFCASSF